MVYGRIRAGYSQGELADLLHVSRQTISAVETDRSIPSVSLAIAIANALDRTVEELFDRAILR